MVHCSGFLCSVDNNGFVGGKLSCLLSFIISTGQGFERTIDQYLIGHRAEKRTGHLSVYHFSGVDYRVRCDHKSNELFAFYRSWIRKGSATGDPTKKHGRKKHLCITKE